MIDTQENIFKIDKGEIIYREGEGGDHLYLIESGTVLLIRKIDNKEVLMFRLSKGDFFGIEHFLKFSQRKFSAICENKCELRKISLVEDEQLCRFSQKIGLAVYDRFEYLLNTLINADFTFEEYISEHDGNNDENQEKRIKIVPMTPRAKKMLKSEDEIFVNTLPFVVGRNCTRKVDKFFCNNDLNLYDHHPYCVSRSHFMLEMVEGNIILKDLKSKLGTIVNGEKLKSKHHFLFANLKKGENNIYIGSRSDKAKFKIIID